MDIFSIVEFKTDPTTAIADLNEYLEKGMPANIRQGEVRESPSDPLEGLLHTLSLNATPETLELAEQMLNLILEYGAQWNLLNSKNETAGCICWDRGIPELYQRLLSQGVASEVFLRRMTEDKPDEENETMENTENGEHRSKRMRPDRSTDEPEANVDHYLRSNLTYTDSTLTTDQQDGVMMDWETPIMELSAKLITKPQGSVLNVGFGLGIIDNFIQSIGPAKHYIVEAHPEVLKKMRADGWYERENVVILEGEWKKVLPQLLSKGITFDGIYYDTFSEHYTDMLEFFDLTCGLLEFGGIFSYFNGLGADKQICYDIYKQVAQIDLAEYGFQVEYEMVPVKVPEQTWDGIKRSYFEVKEYALPKITFKLD